MGFKWKGCDIVDWIHLNQKCVQMLVVEKMVMTLSNSIKGEEYFELRDYVLFEKHRATWSYVHYTENKRTHIAIVQLFILHVFPSHSTYTSVTMLLCVVFAHLRKRPYHERRTRNKRAPLKRNRFVPHFEAIFLQPFVQL
jgi:hypothetical protein